MQTIGERLEEARKKKGASLREAADATKVRGEYLQKFESNQFDIGLGDLYVRGFLRSYAVFLGLPYERILADYQALGHGEARPRQPSREVYGRMDLSISSAEDRRQAAAAEAAQSEAATAGTGAGEAPRPTPFSPRGRSAGTATGGINQALLFKGIVAVAGVIVLLLILWGVKALMGGGSGAEAGRAAAPLAIQRAPDAMIGVVALAPVQVKVVRQSDGAELYQGPLAANEKHEFENVPLYLTASALESVVIEYQGKRYRTGFKGHDRVAIPAFH